MKKRNKLTTLLKMLKLVKPLSGHMLLAVIAGTLAYLSVEFIPILGTMAVLKILGKEISLSLKSIRILLIVFALSRSVLRYIEQKTNHYIAFTILAIVRDKVFQALRKLCPAKLAGRDKGDLVSLITADVELLEVFYAHTISPIFIALTSETVMVLYIASYNRTLGLIALLSFLAVGVLVPLIISRISSDNGEQMRQKSADLSSYVLENIRGLDETLQYRYQDRRKEGMAEKTADLTGLKEKMNDLTGYNLAIANTMILLADIIMLLAGVYLYQNGQVSFEGFLIAQVALMSSFGPVSALSALGSTLQSTVASCGRILDVLEETPETEDISGQADISYAGAEVKDVCFSYGEEEVLKDISMDLENDRIIGILGRSGSGKSTLLRLLMRFWRVQKGQITVSDRSFMSQETEFFKDSIRNNIRIGKLDATDEEIIEACKKASIHDFILSLPEGYDSKVGELGDTLSGGERQRIGLARAFLHDSDMILLDEPTSNLDALNEAIILKSLKESAKDKTIVLVSHRPSTMRIADKTYSVEDGRMS
mgnify:CR=1 FL=1